MTNNKSAALFRAANITLMDYPFEAAIASALNICDEAVVIMGPSYDNTQKRIEELKSAYKDRLILDFMHFHYDRGWQERWWEFAQSKTDAEWLMYYDADEIISDEDALSLRKAMQVDDVGLISLPFTHFWGTRSYIALHFPLRAMRLGKRSLGFRMVNWCSDENPTWPACQMVFLDEGMSANGYEGPEALMHDAMIYHYSWCRDAKSLQLSQIKHVDWYSDGQRFGLLDGRIPDSYEPYEFDKYAKDLLNDGKLRKFEGQHPRLIYPWLTTHHYRWARIEEMLCTQ